MRTVALVTAMLLAFTASADAAGKRSKQRRRKAKAAPVTQPVARDSPAPPPVVEAPPPPPVAEPPASPADTPRATTAARGSAALHVDRAAAPQDPRAPRLITLALEERPFWRRMRYRDNLDDSLRPSDLVANAVGLEVTVRPVPGLRGLAAIARYERAVGVNGSRTPDGAEYGTSASELSLGIAFDTRVSSVGIGLGVAYGQQRFEVDDEAAVMAGSELVPDVTYGYARAGVTLSVPLAPRWDLSASGGYRHLVGEGELTESMWFPRATGAGMDAGAMLAFHATPWLEVYARADVRRYFFALHPEVGDPWIAGGATDQYVGGAIGIAVSPR